jgi:predicted nucleic acid-binding protein
LSAGYLLDTVTVSEATAGRMNPGVSRWLKAVNESQTYLSVLTIGEIQKGVDRLERGSKRRAEIEHWLLYALIAKFGERILRFDIETARLWGTMTASSLDRGRPVPVVDSQIASTARLHSLTVVTRNEKHFKNLGVGTLNPWS